MRSLFRNFIYFSILILFSSKGFSQEDRITFLPHWLPQAQFAGYYMAKEKGIYEKYGLDVILLPGGPKYPVDEMLESGKADIVSNFLSGGIQAYNDGIDLVNIGQLSQISALMFVSK